MPIRLPCCSARLLRLPRMLSAGSVRSTSLVVPLTIHRSPWGLWLVSWTCSPPSRGRRFLQGLSFHINLDPERPLGVRRQAQLEHRLGLRIIDVLTDGESFGLLRCECGAFHPPDRAGFNIVEAHGRAAARTGSLTLDGAGRTPFVVSLESVACPFIGPTRSLVCHGREEQVVLSGPVPVGPADVENELCGFGVYVEAQCRCMTGGLDVTVTPYASEDFDASAATRALKRRFGLTGIRVICADAP